MKILVVSDSHSGLSYMRRWAALLQPQVVIHLGDYFDDAEVFADACPDSGLIQVPGNCDRCRMWRPQPEVLTVCLEGVRIFLTHGHCHGVKSGPGALIAAARKEHADVALYGHTHQAVCYETDGLWVLNPGSCGSSGGSVGLLELEQGRVLRCRVLHKDDMEEFE